MGEMRNRTEQLQELKRLIAEWNASRLDMFAISEPNEDLEYRGAMRFYFQDSGSKVATKCVRFTSMDNTVEVTKVLVEKFHPDMKMLSNPSYSLYEVHQNKESRKLRPDEYPLRIQLGWQNNDREGRFLLVSDADKIAHSNLFETSKLDKTENSNLKRSLSRREKKQLKKKREEEAKKAAENKKTGKDDIATHLYDELPETSFTRSISNPEAVMRRRRQQKIEKRLKDFQSKDAAAGGTLKIFATTLKPEIPYKTLLVSVDDNTIHVIKEALIKYQMESEDPEDYCLIMVNIPPEGQNTSATIGKERVVHDEDCPLKIAVTWPPSRGTVVFHLRRRANLPQSRHERRRSKSPARKPVDRSPEKSGGESVKQQSIPEHLLPYLHEIPSDGMPPSYKPRIHRLQMNVTEVGSEKCMSSGGNYLVLHAPHILQRHCVITNMDGRVSVTPSSGDAEVSVNGKRIYETTSLMHSDVVKIGRVHAFKFCDPAFEKPSRHSAPPGYHDDGSLSSSSDIEAPRRRPSSLGSPLKSPYNSHHPSNDYPSSHDNQEHIEKNPGMFETTFDVTGEVTTYSGCPKEPEPPAPRSPPPRTPPPRTPTQTSFAHEDLYDDKLPATLEFLEMGEDAFFAAVVSEVNGQAVHFKLAPTYTLYMCARFRMSPAYRSELTNHQRGERLGVTLLKIANMARSTIRDHNKYPGSLAFWMANCSELLHFIKQDRDISPYTKEGQPHGQQVLAQSVHQAFRDFVRCAQNELRTVMAAFIDPTDGADMEDSDLDSLHEKDTDNLPEHSDGRSYHVYGPDGTLSGNDSWFGGRRTQGRATVSEVIYNLSSTMSLLRRCRVNAALTIQVFSQLFHFINTWLFNKLVLEPKLGLCTKDWGRRISKRLARVEKWAEKQGLELAADCHLCRIAQAAHLLQAPKNSSSDVNAISSSCFKLNSHQVRTLLENYRPGPDEYIPQDLVETMVMTAEENADEVARSNGQEVQLEEDWELQLPFLLPEDGYSCEVIRGVPPGLKGFLEPLAKTGLCKLTLQPETSGLWTVYLKKYEKLNLDIANASQSPEIEEIAFNKGRGGMGLSIVAAKGTRQDQLGIYIKQVVKDGPASKDGRLQAGDQILSVNGESLIGVTQERAAEVMVKSGPNVSLKILKQGAIYHGLATLLIQSPTKDSPQRLTPLEPENDAPQSPTLPDDNAPGFLPRHNSTSMHEERFIDDRKRSEVEERLKEEQRLREEEEKRRKEEEERLREEEDLRELERLKEEERLIEESRRKEEEQDEERRREEQIRIEEERARQEEEQRRYEERRRLEEEEERAREEEKLRLEAQRAREAERQRQIKLEEERRRREAEEDEKFRIQEDRIRKRMEEERRVIEEERRKLAEERRLLEEERKKEEERKRSEQQRILDEQRRIEEEKKRIEEEKRRQLKEADERRRAEEERRRLQEEEEEEEAQIIAEEQRRRQELLRREEFRRREDQRRIAEERKRAEEEDRRLANEPPKQRSRRIRFEDEVMPQVTAVEQQPPQANFQPEVNSKKEVVEEEPVVVRGRLTEADINNMNSVFERLEDEQPKDEPPRSPIRVDSRNTRYGRAIVITQGMIQTAQSPTLPTPPDQRKQDRPEEKKETDFERWQRQQRELAERRERLAEEREQRRQEEREREDRDRREREDQERLQREEQERLQRQEQERLQREEQERQQREQFERQERERRQREEQEERERLEREKREREERERINRERQEQEQKMREERERRERMEQAQRDREQREIEERREREKQEAERKRREQEEREKAERERELERQRKEQRVLVEKNKPLDQSRQRLNSDRVVERERKLMYSDDLESSRTLDYIESMSEDEVEREFRRRLEAENKRKSDHQDRRAGGLVSVTRVTYHPDRNDQSERDRRLQMILQEQKMLDKDRLRDGSREVQLKRGDEMRRSIQAMGGEAERKLQQEHDEERRMQQLELQRKIEEQSILREKETEARRQLQEEQRRRADRGSDSDHVMELKERALRDYERRRGLIDLEIAKQQAHLNFQDEIRQKEIDEVKAKFDQQKPVSVLKTTNGSKPKKQVSFSQMSTEIREPSSPTYVVESSSGYTAKITPAASVRLVETRPPAIHTPPDSPLSSPHDSPPDSPRDYPPVPRPPPPSYDDYDPSLPPYQDYDPPPLPPPPSDLLEDDDDFPPPPPPRSPLSDRSSSSSSEPRSPVNNYVGYSSNYSGRNNVASGYGTYPRTSRPLSYPAPADLDSIELNDSLKYSGSNNNITAMNAGIRQTRSLGRIPSNGGNPPPIPKKPEQLGFKDKMKLFNQDKTPESKVTTSRWQREQFGVNGDITYT